MKTIRLRPSKQKTGMMLAVAALLFLATLFVPGAFFITPFLMPLVICPLMASDDNPDLLMAISAGVAGIAAYAQSGDLLLTVIILGATAAAPLVTLVLLKEPSGFSIKHHPKYLMAYLFGMVALVIWLHSKAQPQTVFAYLQQELTAWLQGISNGDMLVIRLAETGYISMPEGLKSAQDGLAAIGPETREQLYRSFAVEAENVLTTGFPDWISRMILAGSLFTLLRVQKHAGRFMVVEEKYKDKKVVVVNPPGFSRLALPQKDFMILAVIHFATLIPAVFTSGALSTVLLMVAQFVNHIITLAGAAAMLRMLSIKRETPAVWQGILAAVFWLFLPDILWLMVAAEPYFVIRNLMDKEEQK